MLHYTYIACRFNVLLSFQVNSDRIEGFVFVTAAQSVFFVVVETAFKYYLHVLKATKFKDEKRWF